MKVIASNLYTRGSELKTTDGLDYTGYYHVNDSGSFMSESEYVSGSSVPLMLYTAIPENTAGDLLSVYNEELGDFEGVYTIIPVKNYKNDIDLPQETILLEDPSPVTITAQPELYFKRVTDEINDPGLEVFIDESNIIRVRKGTSISLRFGYESADSPSNITFEWFDSFDRVISNDPILVIDTNEINTTEEVYYCVITDSFGSDTTNEITINIVDVANNNFIYKNIVQNGYATEGTANWDSVGESPEDTGKFLAEYETVEVPDFIFGLNAGTYFYHKFISGPDGKKNKNQWYPRPEDFDAKNNFGGTIIEELKDDYFRAGSFSPVVRDGDNDHKGTIKSSTQIIDLTDFADGLDGKIYGIKGFHAVMFGWLGGRADQADRVSCEMEFLNEADEVIPTLGKNIIQDADWYQRTVNEYKQPNTPPKTSLIHAGYRERSKTISETRQIPEYTGLYQDGNNGIDFERYEIQTQLEDGSTRIVTPIVKTLILGRTTDMIIVPPDTRKIRVIKRYYHVPGVVDLIWEGKQWEEEGKEYVSDALVAGLNVRLYPILIDTETGAEIKTGFDSNGNSVIKFMNFLEEKASDADIAELGIVSDGVEFGTQYYDNQELRFDPVSPVKVLTETDPIKLVEFTTDSDIGYDKRRPVPGEALGIGWNFYCNDPLVDFLETNWPDIDDPNMTLGRKIYFAAPTGLGTLSNAFLAYDGPAGNLSTGDLIAAATGATWATSEDLTSALLTNAGNVQLTYTS